MAFLRFFKAAAFVPPPLKIPLNWGAFPPKACGPECSSKTSTVPLKRSPPSSGRDDRDRIALPKRAFVNGVYQKNSEIPVLRGARKRTHLSCNYRFFRDRFGDCYVTTHDIAGNNLREEAIFTQTLRISKSRWWYSLQSIFLGGNFD